jgi:hypothetical protein
MSRVGKLTFDITDAVAQLEKADPSTLHALLDLLRHGNFQKMNDFALCEFVPATDTGCPDIVHVRLRAIADLELGSVA